MAHDLEFPSTEGVPDWDSLYRARGAEVVRRWTHHNSRAVVPTATYQEVSGPAYEEADLIEEWCEDRVEVGVDIHGATTEAVKWLREDAGGGVMRQRLLEDPQNRSAVRRQLRGALRELR